MQQPAELDRLKERYRFDEWKDAGGATSAPATAISFAGTELPGWRLVRQTRREPQGHPPLVRTMWQGATPESALGIDLHECASAADAREYLLHRLGEAQGPTLARAEAVRAGDVAFATPGESMIAFVRGSIVAVMHSAGRRVEPLGDAARSLDQFVRERTRDEGR